MSTSVTKTKQQLIKKIILHYSIVTTFIFTFGVIYEYFSYGVYSPFMMFAFLFPLIGGILEVILIKLAKYSWKYNAGRKIYHAGLGFLTMGSIVRGILDIYGTTNSFIKYYWIIGTVLICVGLFCQFFDHRK